MSYDISNFQKEVIERSSTIPVLVDFWAEWCGPCKILSPVLERLAGQNGGSWALAKVDTEQHVDVAREYRIQSIPNVKLFVGGVVVNEFVGALPEYQVQRWLQTALPGKHDKEIAQAEAFFIAGNSGAAQALLEPIVHEEPDNVQARVLLARSTVFGKPAEAAKLLEQIEELKYSEFVDAIRTFARLCELDGDSRHLPASEVRARYLAACHALATHDFETALREFIEVIRQERYFDDDGARKACIAIFKLLGEDHSLTQQYRREFSGALY